LNELDKIIEQNALRQRIRDNLHPKECQEEALEARTHWNLSISETIELANTFFFKSYKAYSTKRSSPKILQNFVGKILDALGAKNVLEYGFNADSIVAKLFDSGSKFSLTYSGYQNQFARLFKELLPKGSSVIDFYAPLEGEYAVVVCNPPLGLRNESPELNDLGIVENVSSRISDNGNMIWLTSRTALVSKRQKNFVKSLEQQGVYLIAALEIPSGEFSNQTSVAGALLLFGRTKIEKKLIGTLRDINSHAQLSKALSEAKKMAGGSLWRWVQHEADTTFTDVEVEQEIKKILPKGNFELKSLADLIDVSRIEKADKPSKAKQSCIYLPEYVASSAAASLEELTVKLKATYRLSIQENKISPKFLVWILNSEYGKLERKKAGTGTAIRRIRKADIPTLRVPVPPLKVQDKIAKIQSDINLLKTNLDDLQGDLKKNWNELESADLEVSKMLSVTDIEHQIENWWQELPYPLATVYRRYRNSSAPKEAYEALLHFFEVLAVFTAMIGTSYVRAIRADSKELLSKWLSPTDGATLQRTDFNFWIDVTAGSLKALNFSLTKNSSGNKKEIESARIKSSPLLVSDAAYVAKLRGIRKPLLEAKIFRNSKSHGGLLKEGDAKRYLGELENVLRQTFSIMAPFFKQCSLIQVGKAAYLGQAGYDCDVLFLRSSDPQFEKSAINIKSLAPSNSLAFWMKGSEEICEAIPFIKLGSPQIEENNAVYVYNSLNEEGMKWISFDKTQKQEIIENEIAIQALLDLS